MGEFDVDVWGGGGTFDTPMAVADAPSFPIDGARFNLGVNTGSEAPGFKLASSASDAATAPPASGGGWWEKFQKALYTPGTKTEGAGGILGTLGGIAGAALPIASIGSGILNAVNSRDLAQQIARQQPIITATEKQQLSNAQKGADLAPQAAAVAPEIKAVAPKFGALAERVQTDVAAPEVAYGQKLLAMASAGTLMDADQASLDKTERDLLSQAEDYLARSGQGDSSARGDILAKIKLQVEAMKSQVLAGYRAQGLQFMQAGGGEYGAAGGLDAEEAAVLGASVLPITSAGAILSSSAGAAGAAGAEATAEQKTLEELIAAAQAQINQTAARAA